MSHAIVNQIRRLPIKNPAKAVLWVIADIADNNGYAYPSHATLAAECGVTDRTVINCIQQLEACGVLVANRTNGRHTTYTVTPENFTQIDQNPRTTFTPEPRSPLNDVHHTPEQHSPHPRTTFTQPLNDVHTNPHKPPINPQLTPSVIAHEETEQTAPSPTKKTKAEKNTVTVEMVMERITGISEQAAKDLIAHRLKDKKTSFTDTALKIMAKHMLASAVEHGLPIDDVVGEFLMTTWTGFRSDWFTNRIKSKPKQVSQSNWQQEQNDKWGAFLGTAGQSHPKTVSPDNVIPFAVLEVRHG